MNMNPNRRKFIKTVPGLVTTVLASSMIKPQTLFSQNKLQRVKGVKIKMSLNAYSFNQMLKNDEITLDDLIRYCAQLGFDAIDATAYYFPGYPAVPDDHYLYQVKRHAFLNGLSISGTGIRNDFSVPDQASRDQDKILIKNWIQCAAKLGAPVLRIFSGKNIPAGYTRDQVIEWMVPDILECVDCGRNHGVIVAVQNHDDFLKTADDVVQLVTLVNSDWFGVVLDIGSFRSFEPYQEILAVAPYAVSWQLKENVYVNDKPVPTDLSRIVAILQQVGYRGYLPIETLGEGHPRLMVKNFLKKVQTALAQ